jgi:hypothetical protein
MRDRRRNPSATKPGDVSSLPYATMHCGGSIRAGSAANDPLYSEALWEATARANRGFGQCRT